MVIIFFQPTLVNETTQRFGKIKRTTVTVIKCFNSNNVFCIYLLKRLK